MRLAIVVLSTPRGSDYCEIRQNFSKTFVLAAFENNWVALWLCFLCEKEIHMRRPITSRTDQRECLKLKGYSVGCPVCQGRGLLLKHLIWKICSRCIMVGAVRLAAGSTLTWDFKNFYFRSPILENNTFQICAFNEIEWRFQIMENIMETSTLKERSRILKQNC